MKRLVLFSLIAATCCTSLQSAPVRELGTSNKELGTRNKEPGTKNNSIPAEWSPVQTNAIARWKAENKAPDGVAFDKESHSVRFLAEAAGVRKEDVVEFFAIGPFSDRAYESLLVSVASPASIARACEAAGIPCGRAVDPFAARLWPYGEKVSVGVRALASKDAGGLGMLTKDVRVKDEGEILAMPAVWTGGVRDDRGNPVANTNMPCAVFALYNHAPSLLQLDGMFDQSSVYGRFAAAASRERGELFEVKVAWDGKTHVKDVVLTLNATNAASQIASVRQTAKDVDLHLRLAFGRGVTVAEAATLAQAFDMLDGKGLKMNGAADGQFYFRSFLPDPAWRERAGRIFQPFEVHVKADGTKTFVFCEEDWSGDGIEPVLKPHETPFSAWNELPALISKTGEQGAKVTVLFLFAPSATLVETLTPILQSAASRVNTYYVFAED